MALSEIDASPVLPLFDVLRALRERARRTQELAQEITFRRLRGLTPDQIREQLEIDDDWFVAAEALIFEGQQLVLEEMAACSPAPQRRSDRAAGLLDWPVGRMLVAMKEIMTLRVRHAEMFLSARAIDHNLTLAQVRAAMGVDQESFKVARRWLEDAGLAIRDE
ncbi:MAG: hypothetical protein ACTHMY_27980 [Solirubrobacteraceae bacterium]